MQHHVLKFRNCTAGKVLIPTSHFIRTLVAARLAADVAEVNYLLKYMCMTQGILATHLLQLAVQEARLWRRMKRDCTKHLDKGF